MYVMQVNISVWHNAWQPEANREPGEWVATMITCPAI